MSEMLVEYERAVDRPPMSMMSVLRDGGEGSSSHALPRTLEGDRWRVSISHEARLMECDVVRVHENPADFSGQECLL